MKEGRVYIGPAGWSYPDWKGIVYPADVGQRLHPLRYLAQFFDTVEVNSSFYRPPEASHCQSWIKQVAGNPKFLFTAKLWRGFTHQRDPWPGDGAVSTFKRGVAPLHDAGKLGAILIQFPWSFKRSTENRKWLARVVEAFSEYPLAVEVRHASWDQDTVLAGFRERNVAFCNIDQPMFKYSLPPTEHVTSDLAYIRLHGRNRADWFREDAHRDERYNYLYSVEDLAVWLERIRRMRQHAHKLFVVTNNHYEGQAVVNAFELRDGLESGHTEAPDQLRQRYPRLGRDSNE